MNELSNRDREVLTMAAEECAEIIQVISKSLRHGADSYHPEDPYECTNDILLQNEIMDFLALLPHLLEDMAQRGTTIRTSLADVSGAILDDNKLDGVWQRKLRWMHHRKE